MRPPARALAVTAAALATIAAAAAPAAAAETSDRVTPFAAKHTFGCQYAATEGELHWTPELSPAEKPGVGVTGVLFAGSDKDCATARRPFVEFTAYTGMGSETVDYEMVAPEFELPPTEDGLAYRLNLTNEDGMTDAPIDLIRVRVCHDAGPMLPAFSCGDPEYLTLLDIVPQ